MINDIHVIEEDGHSSFLIIRSDRSILVVSSDLCVIGNWNFKEELSTCNGLYVWEYGNSDEREFDDNTKPVQPDAIERLRGRFRI